MGFHDKRDADKRFEVSHELGTVPLWDEAFQLKDALVLAFKLWIRLPRVLLVSKNREFETLEHGGDVPCAVFSLLDLLETLGDHFEFGVGKDFLQTRDQVNCALHLDFAI